jgi:hypothetical protein
MTLERVEQLINFYRIINGKKAREFYSCLIKIGVDEKLRDEYFMSLLGELHDEQQLN